MWIPCVLSTAVNRDYVAYLYLSSNTCETFPSGMGDKVKLLHLLTISSALRVLTAQLLFLYIDIYRK